MAEFLTTSGTSHHIENIIIEANSKLILVSPYLQISKTLFERLKDASNRRIPIKIIYGKDELKPNEKNSLAELRTVELFYFENLHAKCYFNESKMVITSMNMYEFSERTNREMGVLIDSINDKALYDKASAETFSILQSSEKVQLKKASRETSLATKTNTRNVPGYCIRCEDRIPHNPTSPYCSSCYNSWSHWKNYDYEESVCHTCGQYETTTMDKPQCYNCFTAKK